MSPKLAHLRSGHVLAGARVDLDGLAGTDEERHLHHVARFEGGRLAGARDAVPLDAGLGLGDRELDGRRATPRR